MHTLSEQLHATNMVRLAKGVCVCVYACLFRDAIGTLVQLC